MNFLFLGVSFCLSLVFLVFLLLFFILIETILLAFMGQQRSNNMATTCNRATHRIERRSKWAADIQIINDGEIARFVRMLPLDLFENVSASQQIFNSTLNRSYLVPPIDKIHCRFGLNWFSLFSLKCCWNLIDRLSGYVGTMVRRHSSQPMVSSAYWYCYLYIRMTFDDCIHTENNCYC